MEGNHDVEYEFQIVRRDRLKGCQGEGDRKREWREWSEKRMERMVRKEQ